MAVKVKADCYLTSTNNQATNEFYCNIVQFLTSSDAAALGIRTVEVNRGLNGRGLNYFDTSEPVGVRSWAVFRFLSASQGQFDLVISYTTGSTTSIPFNISTTTSDGTSGLVGISFASHPSGSLTVPWNGSSGSFTSGTVGTPVFKTDASGRLAVWPRANGPGGTYATNKQFQTKVASQISTAPCRQHIILTENSFTVLHDNAANSTNYKILHFGPITPRSGILMDSPYCMFQLDTYGAAPSFFPTTIGPAVAASTTTNEGGIAHPTLTNGVRTAAFHGIGQAGTQTSIDYLNTMLSSSYEVLPYYAGIKDGSDAGILGTFVNVSIVYGTPAPTVNPASSSVVIGSSTPLTQKFVLPWAGPSPGYSSTSRSGRIETGT